MIYIIHVFAYEYEHIFLIPIILMKYQRTNILMSKRSNKYIWFVKSH